LTKKIDDDGGEEKATMRTTNSKLLDDEIKRVRAAASQDTRPFLMPEQAAEILTCTAEEIAELIERKELVSYQMLGRPRIIPASVYDFFCAQLAAAVNCDQPPRRPPPPVLRQVVVTPQRERRVALSQRLKQTWPTVFSAGPLYRPLATDIYSQLCRALPETDPNDLLMCLNYYCNNWDYLRVLGNAGIQRVNLDGSNAGAVTAAEAKEARDKLQLSIARAEDSRE
jgi:hypothetical protein